MKRFPLLLVLVFAGGKQGLTDPRQIVARHVEAIGGQSKLDRIQTLRIVSRSKSKDGKELLLISESMKPDSFRVESVSNGKRDIFVVSGKSGYVKQSINGPGEIRKLENGDAEFLWCLANFGTYVTSCLPPSSLRLEGQETVDGRVCYKLAGRLKNLTIEYLIETNSYHLVQMRTQADGEELRTIETFREFSSVNGVVFPKTTISETLGIATGPRVNSNSVEVNIKFDHEHFGPPK